MITGSERLRERPIAPLVAALRELGADISYLGAPDCAPLRVAPSTLSDTKTIDIDQAVEKFYTQHSATPLFKGYPGRVPYNLD